MRLRQYGIPVIVVLLVGGAGANAQPADAPLPPFERPQVLEVMASLAHYMASLQDTEGAIVDPFIHREHQYSTPYFAAGAALLLREGKAPELMPQVLRAMEHATACFAGGHDEIPDGHGEFFLAPLTLALDWLEGIATEDQRTTWRERLKTPLDEIILGRGERINNWRTYAMKGEWLRECAGLVPRDSAVEFIEDAWLNRGQRERIVLDRWSLYQDWNGDPQSLAVEAVGRGNLLGLIAAGYDGPSADEIRHAATAGTRHILLLQSPDGQCPPNGRTDNHVFNDILYAANFGVLAGTYRRAGDMTEQGQFNRAAQLAFQSALRWQRDDGPWKGSFYVTKNRFDPAERVGYQPASQYTNYNATILFHLAELYEALEEINPVTPAASEQGGFAFEPDDAFGSVTANAAGLHVFANLRGDHVPKYGDYWTPLGIVRFAKAGWDGRLGPSDGTRDGETGRGVSFGPTWQEAGNWVTLAEKARDYRGTFERGQRTRTLVKLTLLYAPVTGVSGPTFRMRLTLTPDGVYIVTTSPSDSPLAVTVPMLEDDGEQTVRQVSTSLLQTRYKDGSDEQNVLLLNNDCEVQELELIQSGVGWLRPVRVTTGEDSLRIFVYPCRNGDPPAVEVLESFNATEDGFDTILGRVAEGQFVANERATARNRELEQALTELDAAWPEKPETVAHHRATLLFKLGRYEESIADYDRAAKHGRPHDDDSCWERGLAHYYAGNYREGAAQFQRYHTVGPTDIENGLWYFLCIAEEEGIEKAREKMFPYPRMRPAPFPALFALYMGKGTTDAVFEDLNSGKVPETERTEHGFFAHYYVAKYRQLKDNQELFQKHLQEALKHPFQHFMYACAEADPAHPRD